MNRWLICLRALLLVSIAASVLPAQSSPHQLNPLGRRDRPLKNLTFSDVGQPTGSPSPAPPLGTRTDCLQQLIAVSPKAEEVVIQPETCTLPAQERPTLTVSELPAFWFYVPAQSGAVSAEFELLGEGSRALVREQVSLSGEMGIIGVRPSYPLDVGRSYTWQFRVDVNPRRPSENPRVRGTVQRVALDPALSAQLEAASVLEQIALYANHGIWHETVTLLADLRRAEPQPERSADWSSLLSSVRLGAIADAPLLDCCPSPPAPH